ncbi:hypothetical protein COY28_02535 [Candidatus Woesearchaeota archaeon CG_4_10_14_0_2_um_filter_57_5]|nr:MAG: hypothetical protein AUJ68_04570 [Candidatus Woesearchaeota archaeon CG1_02_57_44]PIZ54556.1 MAG: hypothetical protein COY28_02535 [Candidatus Woesearchaeota archaeon CG_4_10_14_0_2_um_filter_57_5]
MSGIRHALAMIHADRMRRGSRHSSRRLMLRQQDSLMRFPSRHNPPRGICHTLADGSIILGTGLLLPEKEGTLILGDLHLGFEQQDAGRLMPADNCRTIIEQIGAMLERAATFGRIPRRVVLNGDIKHGFGPPTRAEKKEIGTLLAYLRARFASVIVVRGNHDTGLSAGMLGPDVKLCDRMTIGQHLITHGDCIPHRIGKNVKTLIVGHEHPAIAFRERPTERFKCFLLGHLQLGGAVGRTLAITFMPSAFTLNQGSNVLAEKPVGPLLPLARNLHVMVVGEVGEQIMDFGNLADLHKF